MKTTDTISDHEPVFRLLQTLDIEHRCKGVFSGGQMHFDNLESIIQNSNTSWQHSVALQEEKYTYVSLFLKGAPLEDYSDNPENLSSSRALLEAQQQAALTAKIDFSDMCFFDLIPDHLIYRWFSLREQAMLRALEKIKRPRDYDILHKIHVLASTIASRNLNTSSGPQRVEYDIFSSATGRMATKKASFPILSISKNERENIFPQNDMFLELDINGAEIRTLLALSGKEQPNYDVHEYNREVLIGDSTRKEAKARFFAWLYNPKAFDKELEKLYNKDVYRKFYEEGYITTPFGRKLEVDERRALNYLTQSTTSDIVLENAYKIMKLLKAKRSFVAFTMHDSVVLDFCKEEHGLVKEIKDIFETNMFGRFLSTVNIGKNYGNLKEIKVD